MTEQPLAASAYVLPHEDVVLYALIHVANAQDVHPHALVKDICRRPALLHWLTRNTTAMHYTFMRRIIVKLANVYGVEFETNGFRYAGAYHAALGVEPPAITANPLTL